MPRVSMTAQMMRDDEHYQHYKIDTRKKIKFSIDIFILKLLIKFLLCIIRRAGSVVVVNARQVIDGCHVRLLLLFCIVVKIVMLLNDLVVHHLLLKLILVLLLKQVDRSCAVEAASVSIYCRRLYSRMM